MRGAFTDQGGLFSYISPEARVPATHPLRKIRELVRDVLSELNRSLGRLYASEGRPSIPPEQLLSALLLQVFYGIRSERQLMEQLDYNLLYRWFVGLSPDDPVWDPTTFTKNRDRLQNGEVFTKFMSKLLNHPQVKPLLSDGHFSVVVMRGQRVQIVTLTSSPCAGSVSRCSQALPAKLRKSARYSSPRGGWPHRIRHSLSGSDIPACFRSGTDIQPAGRRRDARPHSAQGGVLTGIVGDLLIDIPDEAGEDLL